MIVRSSPPRRCRAGHRRRPCRRRVKQSTAAPRRPRRRRHLLRADDALEINTCAIADLSDDGRWIALTQSVRRDGYGNDYRHDGDPTYVHPTPVRLWSVDARTGQRRRSSPTSAPCAACAGRPTAASSRCSSGTATSTSRPCGTARPESSRPLKMPAGKYVAETSDCAGTARDRRSSSPCTRRSGDKKAQRHLHADDRRARCSCRTARIRSSRGTISAAWANIAASARSTSKPGQYHELVPEAMITSYTLAEDGTVDRVRRRSDEEDRLRGGWERQRSCLRAIAGDGNQRERCCRRRAARRSSGRRTASATRTRATAASTSASSPTRRRSIIAGPPEPPKGAPAPPADTLPTRRAGGRGGRAPQIASRRRRFSPRGDALLLSNREGLWVVRSRTRTRAKW